MNAIDYVLQFPWVKPMGAALLHFLWQGAAVGLISWILLRALQTQSAKLRYAVACGALLLCVLLPVASFLVLIRSAAPAAAVSNIVGRPIGTASTGSGELPEAALGELLAPTVALPAVVTSDNARNTWARYATLANAAAKWAVPIWLLGVLVLGLRMCLEWCRLQRWRRESTVIADPAIVRVLVRIADGLGLTRSVELLLSDAVPGPLAFGWWKPVILMPAQVLTGLSAESLEAILAHELAHIRRYDYLVNVLQSAVEVVLFYHPVVWWLSRQVREIREECCDDIAAQQCGDRLVYAKALASLVEIRFASEPALAGSGGSVLGRISRVLGRGPVRPTSTRRSAAWALALGFVAVAALALSYSPKLAAAVDAAPAPVKTDQAQASPNESPRKPLPIELRRVMEVAGPNTETLPLPGGLPNEVIHFEKQPVLEVEDVSLSSGVSANVRTDIRLRLGLTTESRREVAKATAESVSKRIAILLGGTLRAAPIVGEMTPGGSVEIAATFSEAVEAREFVDSITEAVSQAKLAKHVTAVGTGKPNSVPKIRVMELPQTTVKTGPEQLQAVPDKSSRKPSLFELRQVMDVAGPDTETLPVQGGLPNEVVHLEKRRVMEVGDVRSAELIAKNGRMDIRLVFTEEGQWHFVRITAESVGKRIAFLLGGTVRTAPVVREMILGGSVDIAGSFSEDEARELVGAITEATSQAKLAKHVMRFRVIDEKTSAPIVGALMTSAYGNGTTDADGRWSVVFQGPFPRHLAVSASKANYFRRITSIWRDQLPVMAMEEHTVPLKTETFIGTEVRDESGHPIAGATVQLAYADPAVPINDVDPWVSRGESPEKTDANGRWRKRIVEFTSRPIWVRLTHPDYASDRTFRRLEWPPETLLQQNAVLAMTKGFTLKGVIVDSTGRPMRGSIFAGKDWLGTPGLPRTFADEQGNWVLPHVSTEDEVLTVVGTDFAPLLVPFTEIDRQGVNRFVVSPGRRWRIRVVDLAGKPVSSASLRMFTWRGLRSFEHAIITNEDGRGEWSNAPEDEVRFTVQKEDYYKTARDVVLVAGDEEQVVVLNPALRVRGKVTDADTGAPIPAFRAIPGNKGAPNSQTFWDWEAKEGSNGAFELDLKLMESLRPVALVKVEAKGYRPAISRPLMVEGVVSLDFQLEKEVPIPGGASLPEIGGK